MSKFCNFCHGNDIDYQKIINKNFNAILENMNLPPNEGRVFVYGGMCEGCGMSGIMISQKCGGLFEIYSADIVGDKKYGLLGKLVTSNKKSVLIEKVKNHNHCLIAIYKNSKLYKKKRKL